VSLYVYLAAVNTSAQAWEDTSETVRGSRKSLSDVVPSLLGDRVESHAQAFIDAWMIEIKRLETLASDHGDSLREAALLFDHSDRDAVERSQQLMAWTDRTVSPTGRTP
jgi:hypothetical protein